MPEPLFWIKNPGRKAHAYQTSVGLSLCSSAEVQPLALPVAAPILLSNPVEYCLWCMQIVVEPAND